MTSYCSTTYRFSLQETQLSLTNHATQLCKCNDMTDLLKHPSTYDVTSRNLVVLGLGGEPAKLAPWDKARGRQPINKPLVMCVPRPISSFSFKRCSHRRETEKLGSASAPPLWDWVVVDSLDTSPPHVRRNRREPLKIGERMGSQPLR